ncbi:MAG: alpha/beta hydrolase [Proteobacteria bacterium]|nr:alpha/beta hydrolase [Pseudomonadota bacterium]MBU1388109.1 alpha/beta hydrolase [Pseudomonadota bacterium]MBU1542173.1 alpha/beta hydrolase [Pseudomonadota bacterium]MBU2429731.1 alpha/beta hydrolase [Pseudomonadota bacterium]MBU2481671.1 alpha/beta hydrolase [Pseudomonadota bacterium]
MTTSHFIEIPQGRFHYYKTGTQGDQIFFCHGNSMSAGTYLPFLEKLASPISDLSQPDLPQSDFMGFQILAPDVRGHGSSTKENTQKVKSWDIFLKDLEQLVQSITRPPVIGMGHSMGGYFIYAAAAMYPHLFSKIILLDPIILPRKVVWSASLARTLKLAKHYPLARLALKKKSQFSSRQQALAHYSGKGMFKTWEARFVQAYVDTAMEKDPRDETCSLCCAPEFEARMYTLVPFNTWRHAGHIHVPTLVVRGQHSEMFARQSGLLLEHKIKNCHFIEMENLGHFFTMEDPDAVVSVLKQHL